MSVLLLLFWGPLWRGFRKKTRSSGKRSTCLGFPMEYWGYGLIGLGALDAYVSWNNIARDWFASV